MLFSETPMDKAYDQERHVHHTVKEFVAAHGTKLDSLGRPRKRPPMVCYACFGAVHTVAEGLPPRDGHWAHSPDGPWCPLKEGAARRYGMLQPGNGVSEEESRQLRQSVLDNWRKHWGHIQELVKLPDINAFVGFLRWADTSNLWRHRGLQEWFVPYMFLAHCEQAPPASEKGQARRSNWLRFWFDARVRTFEDLWIRTTGDFRVIKATYTAPPRGGVPGPQHLVGSDPVIPDPTFLIQAPRLPANAYQVRKMRDTFGVQ